MAHMLTQEPIYKPSSIFCFKPILLSAHKLTLLIYGDNTCVPGNAYILETLEGEEYSRTLNGKYLKKYYPSVWVDA